MGAIVVTKIGKKEGVINDRVLRAAIEEFAYLKLTIDDLNDDLSAAKETIAIKAKDLLEDNGAGTIMLCAGETGIKVSFGWDIKIGDPDKLSNLLGADRFSDLVRVETTYKPEQKLKEMALIDESVKQLLTIKEKAAAISLTGGVK